MANYAKPLQLRDGDRATLESLTRGKDSSASLALRARTVLLAADGVPNIRIVESTGFSEPTVRRWRTRYEESGIQGLGDAPRPGKPRALYIVTPCLIEVPQDFGNFTHSELLIPALLRYNQ